MARPGDTTGIPSQASLAWALRETRLLFPQRQLTAAEAATHEVVAEVWARQHAADPVRTASGLAKKIAFDQSVAQLRAAHERFDRTARDYFGPRYEQCAADALADVVGKHSGMDQTAHSLPPDLTS